jgi:hypothetical protein
MPQPTILDVGDSPLIADTTPPEPIQVPDVPSTGEPSASELEFRYRQERRPVPRDVADGFAQAIGAPDPAVALQWAQMGRDAQFHREQLELERQSLEDERRQMQLRGGAYEPPPQYPPQYPGYNPYPGVPSGGYPYPPQMPQPGGYPQGTPYEANPQGYPQAGGNMPYAPAPYAPPIPTTEPGRDASREELLSLQRVIQQQNQQLALTRADIQRQYQAAQQLRMDADARSQEQFMNQTADMVLGQARTQGLPIPDGYTSDQLIADMNRFGLSGMHNVPWPDAMEMAMAKRFWRPARDAGAASVAQQMLTDRESSFRVPPARAAATAPAGDIPQGDSLEARVQRARQIGDRVPVREALGHRQ